MQKKRLPADRISEKKSQIDTLFSKAAPIVRNAQKVESLKKDSTLRKLCVAIRLYIYGIDVKEGCIQLYEIFHVRPFRKNDIPVTNYIKESLQKLKNTEPPQQLSFPAMAV